MRYQLILLLSLVTQICFAGVFRHDVDVQKYKDLAAEKQFDCAGIVIMDHSHIAGSCVLIGDKYVLSAAHVFIETTQEAPDTMHIDGKLVLLHKVSHPRVADLAKYSFRFGRQIRYGKKLTVHPIYLDSITRGRCDLVVIELDEPVTDIIPATLNKDLDELHCKATGVGWGASGKANEPENVGMWFEEIAGQNMIDSLSGYKLNGKPTFMLTDFDHPTNVKDCNKMGSPVPLTLEYVPSGGDSGGGLFTQDKDGNWLLIGTCTGAGVNMSQLLKTGYYGQGGGWTRVSVFYDWIQNVMKGK